MSVVLISACGQSAPGPTTGPAATTTAASTPTAAPATMPPPTVEASRKPVASVPPATTIQPSGAIDLPGADIPLAAGDELWVRDLDSIHRIDRDSLEIDKSVRIAEDFGPFAIAGKAVWITDIEDGFIVGYDLSTGEEVARIPVGLHPNVVFEAAGSVWGYNLHGRFIERIDPEQRETEHEWAVADITGSPTAPLTEDAVWFGAYDHQRLVAINPATNGVAAGIEVGIGACGATVFPSFILGGACNSRAFVRADPTTGAVLERGSLPGVAYGWTHLGGLAWTVLAPGPDLPTRTLVGFDQETLQPMKAVDLGVTIRAATVAFDALWVATENGVLRFELDELRG